MSEDYVFGFHAVSALVKHSLRSIKKLYISEDRKDKKLQTLLSLALQKAIPVEKLSMQKMKQRFASLNHQGVVALAGELPDYGETDLSQLLTKAKDPCLILILDGITDPHNLGACLRTADATGVDFVVIPKDKTAGISAVVSKVASGALEAIPLVRVTNLVRAMEIIKQTGVWIYGAAGEASEPIYKMDFKTSLALVLGREGEGLRRLTRLHCDGLFALPMQGLVSSLNVSVAAGVCLYEVVRQRYSSLF